MNNDNAVHTEPRNPKVNLWFRQSRLWLSVALIVSVVLVAVVAFLVGRHVSSQPQPVRRTTAQRTLRGTRLSRRGLRRSLSSSGSQPAPTASPLASPLPGVSAN